MPELGDAPIQERYRQQMTTIAEALDQIFNGDARGKDRATGFVLLVFPMGEAGEGRCNYISNGPNRNGPNRNDIVVLMKEMIARFEGQSEIKGKA